MRVCIAVDSADGVVNSVKVPGTINTAVEGKVCHVMCTNAHSLGNKLCKLTALMFRVNVEFVAITESWFKDSNNWKNNYTRIHTIQERQSRKEGR